MRRSSLVAATILTLLLVLLPVPAQAASLAKPKAPTSVKVVENGYGKFEVAWKKSKNATLYRVTAATDKAMKHVVYRSAYSKALTRWVHGSGIKEGTRYYVRVQAFNTKKKAGGKSKVVAVTPKVLPAKKPEGITARPTSSTSLKVTWKSAKYATGYTVKLMATATGTPLWSKRVSSSSTSLSVTGIDLAKLKLPRDFFVKVTADRIKKTFRDSDTIAAALPYTAPTDPAELTLDVVDYNVMKSTLEDAQGRTWADRLPLLADRLEGHDLAGVEEADWAEQSNGKRPVQQLAAAAGLAVAMKPGTTDPCSTKGDHLLYDASAFSVGSCGNVPLGNDRYAVWNVVSARSTGAKVFVVVTHLTDGSSSADNSARSAEAKALVSNVLPKNTAGLPVVVMGDLNSYYGRAATTPMSWLTAHGGVVGADLTAATTRGIAYASGHQFEPTKTNGLRIDHILASDDVVVKSFAVDATTASTAPSDHHPIEAQLVVH